MPSYLQRYQTHQDFPDLWHQEARVLWSELISYGPAIHNEPLYHDAKAVAHAIMQRARHNIALLIPRLHELGYRFVDPERIWLSPTPATAQMLDDVEKHYGPLPLLIRAWFDVVGMVNLMGAHPKLSRCADVDWDGSDDRDGDPLVVEALPIGIKYMDRHPPFLSFPFAPDSAFKVLESGGGSLGILIPNAAFDAPILDPGRRWTGTFFIEHLQTCFQWGGFPGLRGGWYPEQVPGAPAAQAELAFLTAGLLPLYKQYSLFVDPTAALAGAVFMILVTGGTGMAGSFIVRELQRRGHPVRVLARHESAEVGRALGVEIVAGDLADADSLRRAVACTSGIVHAARADGRPEVDIAAMGTLLDAWEAGSFVFISSVDVYGYATDRPITEDTPLQPYSGYGAGKVRCEAMLTTAAADKSRRDFSILRPPHIWGPHPRCRERLIDGRIVQGQPIVLPGATVEEWSQFGDAWSDTRELAWAAAECLDRPLAGAANIINDHFGWHELYSALIRLARSNSPIVHRDLATIGDDDLPNKQFYAQTWHYSHERIVQQLGFQPTHQWQDTLAEIVALDQEDALR